jgi:hypothetical protein
MTQTTLSQTTATTAIQPPQEEKGDGWSVTRIAKWAAGILILIFALIFIIGLAFALFADAEQTSFRFQVVRDVVVIIIGIEGILIIVAIAVLIMQVARLVNLLQTEVRPILDNAEAAARSAKGTAEFVGNNVAEPVIKASAFFAGLGVFLRELGGIRRAIRRNHREQQHET